MRRAFFLLALSMAAFGQEDVVVKAMRHELARSMAQLRLENLDKPYFISYRVDDTTGLAVSATLGQLTASNFGRTRFLGVQVRVGDYQLDNTNFFSGRPAGATVRGLPLDDDYEQIRREIWLATDAEYKQAGATLAAKRSVLERRKSAPALPDFTRQAPATLHEPAAALNIDVPALEKLARDLSAVFRGSPEILGSDVEIGATNERIVQLNSEGAFFTELLPGLQVRVGARTQAPDGSAVVDSFHVFGRSTDVFGSEELLARTRALLARLKALRAAPALDRYNGPVLFEDEAVAQVVAQVFAPAVSALRIPMSGDPQVENQIQQVLDQFGVSLADRLDGRVLPEGFDVTDNPLLTAFAGVPLVGSHAIDSEAVPAREIKLVENGRLKTLLATRTPTAQTGASTGSASGPGMAAPSNLFVTVGKSTNAAELRQELLRIAKQRGYGYGIVVRHVGEVGLNGLMRMAMGRMSTDAGATIAAYKLFEDGHEELVRAQIAPVPVAAFRDIIAAGDKPGVYSIGSLLFMGSLTGGTPSIAWSSFIVPPLLFEEVSLKQPTGPSPTSPVAPSPMAAAAN
ncbi:MAG: metallopeptidase TldD-related protein [Bryobacteraceae bacterium]|jgi:hypothetical protein